MSFISYRLSYNNESINASKPLAFRATQAQAQAQAYLSDCRLRSSMT
jgi:hypothetical protein